MTKLLLFSSCTCRLKTEVYNYSNFSTFKINTMSSSLQSFTHRDTFFNGLSLKGYVAWESRRFFRLLFHLATQRPFLGIDDME